MVEICDLLMNSGVSQTEVVCWSCTKRKLTLLHHCHLLSTWAFKINYNQLHFLVLPY